jgi:hypothetical protein
VSSANAFEHLLRTASGLGVIEHRFRAQLVNISGSGCLLELDRPLEVGLTGTLEVGFGGHDYTDRVQVTRCQLIAGRGSTYQVGVQFVWGDRPPDGSIRRFTRNGTWREATSGVLLRFPVVQADQG